MARFNQLDDQYFDGAGNPLIEGKIKFEQPTGGTDKDTFADADLDIKNSNPVILSATGVPPNIFFNGEAKAFLLSSDDVQIRVIDSVPGTGSATDAFSDYSADITYSIEDIVRGSTERYFKSITNANLGNDPVTTTGFWIEINFIHSWNTAYTFSIDFVAIASDSNLYVSRVNSNVGNDPVSSPTEWRLLTETGSVVGPGSSTDNAVARFDTTTGLLLQDSVVLIDDSGNVTGVVALTASGDITGLTLKATGDTSAGDASALGFDASEGSVWTGQGSVSDLTAKNDADATVFDVATGTVDIDFKGDATVNGRFSIGATVVVTIATGAITITSSNIRVDTEASASSDDLDTINGGTNGQVIVVGSNSSVRTVVLTEAGNIKLNVAGNFSLNNNEDQIMLIFQSSQWQELSRSDNNS